MEIEKRIFIGGTGRSGTSILANLFDEHPDVYRIPWESKFIVEVDGLRDLCMTLGNPAYGATHAQKVLQRFQHQMTQVLTSNVKSPTDYFEFSKHLGQDTYDEAVARFFAQVTDFVIDKEEYQSPSGRLIPRQEMLKLARELVCDLFDRAALQRDKRVWAEKTPENLFGIEFLWDLFPEAKILHIKRDPRGVLHSMREKYWAPSDLPGACRAMRALLDRWFALRMRVMLPPHKYAEIRLEDLVESPAEVLGSLYAMLGLSEFWPPEDFFQKEPVYRWQTEMSREELDYVEAELADYFEPMGYSV